MFHRSFKVLTGCKGSALCWLQKTFLYSDHSNGLVVLPWVVLVTHLPPEEPLHSGGIIHEKTWKRKIKMRQHERGSLQQAELLNWGKTDWFRDSELDCPWNMKRRIDFCCFRAQREVFPGVPRLLEQPLPAQVPFKMLLHTLSDRIIFIMSKELRRGRRTPLLNSGTASYKINKSDRDDGWVKCGGTPQRVAALLHRNTLRGLCNGPWSGEMFPVVGALPPSADSIPGGLVCPSSPPRLSLLTAPSVLAETRWSLPCSGWMD